MSGVTTHVLDTAKGRPAVGVPVQLEAADGGGYTLIGRSTTDRDGRCRDLCPESFALREGVYRLTFDVEAYFDAEKRRSFYPSVTIVFRVEASSEHHHVPLLLTDFGYSTYRGS